MLIGICGPAGAGKDTTADFLVKNHGFVKVALADILKRACRDFFDFSEEQLWGPSEMRNAPDLRYPRFSEERRRRLREEDECPPLYLTPRHALQQLGTEFGRACYSNVWVDYMLRIAKRLQEGGFLYSAQRGLVEDEHGYAQIPSKNVAISDVRFRNEVDAIHAAGGKIVRLLHEKTLKGAAVQHRSEQEQLGFTDDMFDFVIDNSGFRIGDPESLAVLEKSTARAFDWCSILPG